MRATGKILLSLTALSLCACPGKKTETPPAAPAAPSASSTTAPAAPAAPSAPTAVTATSFTADFSTPDGATRTFYQSVLGDKFDVSWKVLSKASQDKIVSMVAEEEKMNADEVRKLFDSNDAKIQAGFWQSFKNSSKVDQYVPAATYKLVKTEGDTAQVQLVNKLVVLDSKAYKENGEWKMGYVESFMDNAAPPAAPAAAPQ